MQKDHLFFSQQGHACRKGSLPAFSVPGPQEGLYIGVPQRVVLQGVDAEQTVIQNQVSTGVFGVYDGHSEFCLSALSSVLVNGTSCLAISKICY